MMMVSTTAVTVMVVVVVTASVMMIVLITAVTVMVVMASSLISFFSCSQILFSTPGESKWKQVKAGKSGRKQT